MGKAMLPFFGNGLMSNEDDIWRRHRRVVTPMFHFQILETYVEIFGRKAQLLVEKLQQRVGGPFDIYDDLSLCTLDAICETVIGECSSKLHESRWLYQFSHTNGKGDINLLRMGLI